MDHDPVEVEDVLFPPLDGVEERERSTAKASLGGGSDAICELVADERLRPREENGHQHLRAKLSWRHWLVLLVNNLGDDQVFVAVEPMVLALRGDAGRLSRGVDVEGLDAERRADSRARVSSVRTSDALMTA